MTSVRQQFLQAMAQARQPAESVAAATADATDDPALRGYPLYPYLQAERIRQALSDTRRGGRGRPSRGRLSRHLRTLPVGIQLRRSWLENLAQRGHGMPF